MLGLSSHSLDCVDLSGQQYIGNNGRCWAKGPHDGLFCNMAVSGAPQKVLSEMRGSRQGNGSAEPGCHRRGSAELKQGHHCTLAFPTQGQQMNPLHL